MYRAIFKFIGHLTFVWKNPVLNLLKSPRKFWFINVDTISWILAPSHESLLMTVITGRKLKYNFHPRQKIKLYFQLQVITDEMQVLFGVRHLSCKYQIHTSIQNGHHIFVFVVNRFMKWSSLNEKLNCLQKS